MKTSLADLFDAVCMLVPLFSAWLVGISFGGKIQKDQRMTVRSCLKPTLVGLTKFLNYHAVMMIYMMSMI